MVSFAISIFLSAFLLFQMQPQVGKFLLPRLEGVPLFGQSACSSQAMLVLGHAYPHVLFKSLGPKQPTKTHLSLLAFSLLWLIVRQSGGEAAFLN